MYKRFSPSDCKVKGIRKFEFVAKTPFLASIFRTGWTLKCRNTLALRHVHPLTIVNFRSFIWNTCVQACDFWMTAKQVL